MQLISERNSEIRLSRIRTRTIIRNFSFPKVEDILGKGRMQLEYQYLINKEQKQIHVQQQRIMKLQETKEKNWKTIKRGCGNNIKTTRTKKGIYATFNGGNEVATIK
ncbi:Pleckstrin homology domain-containing family H member 2 [Bienertia sinuspersici]